MKCEERFWARREGKASKNIPRKTKVKFYFRSSQTMLILICQMRCVILARFLSH